MQRINSKVLAYTLVAFLLFAGLLLGLHRYGGPSEKLQLFSPVGDPMVAVCSDPSAVANSSQDLALVLMLEASDLLGEPVRMTTFGLTVGDLNGDYLDDLLLGSHNFSPRLMLNSGTGFADASEALLTHRTRGMDTHAHTLADLDNDGDLDLVITSGGADGVGDGSPNMFFRNDTRNGELIFSKLYTGPEITAPKARSRAFIPLASPDGSKVDLYFTTKLREGYPNRLLHNTGRAEPPFWRVAEDSYLPAGINDRGRGVIGDFDGDQLNDYLVLEGGDLRMYWNPASGRDAMILSKRAFNVTAADFNNDQQLDIFVGRFNDQIKTDRVSHVEDRLIYAVHNFDNSEGKSISFTSRSPTLMIDLKQHVRKTEENFLRGGEDIFVGRNLHNTKSRRFRLHRYRATGEPESFNAPGVYIWYSQKSGDWHIRWKFYPGQDSFKGVLEGKGIASVQKFNLEEKRPAFVSDIVLFNEGGGRFSAFCSPALDHQSVSSGSTVADFNNDGWLDIAGVRHTEPGAENPPPFMLMNVSGREFVPAVISTREEDRLNNSDLIAHGFFNDDDLPDVVISNGHGQAPGKMGLHRLLLNDSPGDNRAILVRLAGVTANRFGIGAKVTLHDSSNRVMGYRIQGLNTNISQDTQWLHFGLGSTAPPYRLLIEWPDQRRSEHPLEGPGQVVIKQPM